MKKEFYNIAKLVTQNSKILDHNGVRFVRLSPDHFI